MRARDQGPAGLAGAPAKAQAWPRWTLGYRASVAWTNWAGNYTYRARAIHAPSTLEQLQELVCGLPRVRVLGSRHSFTDIADCEELVSLGRMPHDVVVDRDARAVSLSGAVRYGELVQELSRERLALANLASLPHIAVAGAVSTATHGSGDQNGNLATAVAGLQIVTSDGNILTVGRRDPDFEGVVVGIGAVGAVARITLDLEPAYQMRQHVFEGLRWNQLFEHFDAITSSGYSVSAFTRWGETTDQVWIKSRVTEGSETTADEFFGAIAAWGSTRAIARRNLGRRARGPNACLISGWASRPAAASRFNLSTSFPDRMPCPRSRPSCGSARRSGR